MMNPATSSGDHGDQEYREECQIVSDAPAIVSILGGTVVYNVVMGMVMKVDGIMVVLYGYGMVGHHCSVRLCKSQIMSAPYVVRYALSKKYFSPDFLAGNNNTNKQRPRPWFRIISGGTLLPSTLAIESSHHLPISNIIDAHWTVILESATVEHYRRSRAFKRFVGHWEFTCRFLTETNVRWAIKQHRVFGCVHEVIWNCNKGKIAFGFGDSNIHRAM